MSISNEQMAEIQKLQKAIEQLEKIQKLSTNKEQKARVTKDLALYREKLSNLNPEKSGETIAAEGSLTTNQVSRPRPDKQSEEQSQDQSLLSQFTIMKISPNSNDHEINMIGTLLNILDIEFIPVLMDTHIKFDFSHAAERDGVIKHMENIRRNIKVLTETIEEHAQAEKQEFREQLGRMKNKQARIFITEAYEVFKRFKDFLEKVKEDMQQGGGVIMNLEDPINFNSRFEKATLLEGKTIQEAIDTFEQFVTEAIENIDIPNIKK